MTHRKKLIEVALPLEAINIACKADKDRKTGTIRNLHKWFAPMPSPAWRALIPAALMDDPEDGEERKRLLGLIEALVSTNGEPPPEEAIARVRERVGGEDSPVVFDPFCGGGSTLIEAQRFGLAACGSDLNPIPVLISRMLTTYLPQVSNREPISPRNQEVLADVGRRFEGLVRDITHYATRILEEAKRRIGTYFPLGPNGDPVIAWWWARTIPSPEPRFQDTHTPLVNDWWISKKRGERAFVRPLVDAELRSITYEVVTAEGGAPASSKARCLFSNVPIPFAYIKKEGKAGHLGTTLLAIVTQGEHGRKHFPSSLDHVEAAGKAQPADTPTLDLPIKALGFRVQEYGIDRWAQLFTARQLLVLETFSNLVAECYAWLLSDGADEGYAVAITTFLGLCVGKLAQTSSMQVRWWTRESGPAKAVPAFSRPDVAPLWDFAETNPFASSVGGWLQIVQTATRAIEFAVPAAKPAKVEQRDARSSADLVPPGSALIATDPPYFSNFGYGDLSNYFYPWLRRALKNVHPSIFSTLGAPVTGELIADPARHGGDKEAAKNYFIEGLRDTLRKLIVDSRPDVPLLIVYAFKQQEETQHGDVVSTGWEAVLEALVGSGLSVVGTWPIHGTGSARLRGLSSNALATYVLLVCRPREEEAPLATFGEFRGALRTALGTAVQDLRGASIAPVDLAQAVVGPGMAVYTRFARIVQADGTSLSVHDALAAINRTLDEVLEESESDFDAETRWATAWFEQFGMGEGPFGVADSLSRAKNTAVHGVQEAGLVHSKGGHVRLLSQDELEPDWDPSSDSRLTVWEMTHQLGRALQAEGEIGASALLRRLGGMGEVARELAYRLHSISDRKNWPKEAQLYNTLVVAWPEIARLAAESAHEVQPTFGV